MFLLDIYGKFNNLQRYGGFLDWVIVRKTNYQTIVDVIMMMDVNNF